ncbi:MAG TPA: hypothetical protein VJI67_02525, partial [archaeon]|nr:hypothetical protein [archaeon]
MERNESKKIVVPGELLSDSPVQSLENAYVSNGKVYSLVLGIYAPHPNGIRVTPLSGVYMPKEGDLVLGVVEEIKFAGLLVDVSSSSSAFLPSSEIPSRMLFRAGDLVSARVNQVDELGSANLSSPGKIHGGELLEVNSSKVPRIIGSKQSMLNLLRSRT